MDGTTDAEGIEPEITANMTSFLSVAQKLFTLQTRSLETRRLRVQYDEDRQLYAATVHVRTVAVPSDHQVWSLTRQGDSQVSS